MRHVREHNDRAAVAAAMIYMLGMWPKNKRPSYKKIYQSMSVEDDG